MRRRPSPGEASSRRFRSLFTLPLLGTLSLLAASIGPAQATEIGRLFFTPAERARLEAARARTSGRTGPPAAAPASDTPPPVRYDGIVIRSDGKTTRWVDGAAEFDGAGPSGLKPGQIRSDGKVYEPYQVLRPFTPPSPPLEKEPAP